MKKTKKKLKHDIVLDAMLVLCFCLLNIEYSLNGVSNIFEAFYFPFGMVVTPYMLYTDIKKYIEFKE